MNDMSTNLYENVNCNYIQNRNIPSIHQQEDGLKKIVYSHYGTLKAMKRNKPLVNATTQMNLKQTKMNLKSLRCQKVVTSVGSGIDRKRHEGTL